MTEVRSIDIDAAELVRNLSRMDELRRTARPVDDEDAGRPLAQKSLRALWSTSKSLSTDLPSVILGSENAISDLLPRILALPGVVTPITSLMKVWLIDDFRLSTPYNQKTLSNVATLGFIGLIVAELKATIGPDADLRLMGMDGVRRTLAFVCAQAVMKGWRHESMATIVQRWVEASTLTANEISVETLVPIANICGFLQALSEFGDVEAPVSESLAHLVQSWVDAQHSELQPDLLVRSLPAYARSLSRIGGREQRYDAVMEMLAQSKSFAKPNHPLEHGFLLSLIEPGSFDFFELARRADSNGWAVAAAYCACAAILGKEATLAKFSGFGWSVINDGIDAGIDSPMDISISELRVLHNARRGAPIAFRTRSPFLVDVELAPRVVGSFGNVARRKSMSRKVEEDSDMAERDELLRERFITALRALEDAYGLLEGRRPRTDRKRK